MTREVVPIADMDQVALIETHLFQGCCHEADRSDLVWLHLDGLVSVIPGSHHPTLFALIQEMRASSQILRELADLSQVYQDRVPIALNHLNVVLPCLSRTLRDITSHYEDRTISRSHRWRKMCQKMAAEVDGITLGQRFLVYNQFLTCLRDLLTRSPHFDLNRLEILRTQIMALREARSIPPPPAQVGPLINPEALISPIVDPSMHWAENIFSLPLPSRTEMKGQHMSMSFGPHLTWGSLRIPPYSKILFRRPFNDDMVSLTVYLSGADQCPYLLLRTVHAGVPWFSQKGAHELCIERDGSCLQLKRWSRSEDCSKLWAILYFMTWEEMVLFHSTFLSLKTRNNRPVRIGPEEHSLHGENMVLQARIVDDGYQHSLIVYEDRATGGIRLHAAVWDGSLRRCPVWTAFVTHQSASPTWLKRVARKRVRLADIQLYVFCHRYRQQSQRRGGVGAFEIEFVSAEAVRRFKDIFKPEPPKIDAPPPPSPDD